VSLIVLPNNVASDPQEGRTAIGFWSGAMGTRSMIQVPWPRDALPVPGCPVTFIPDESWSVVINWYVLLDEMN
jgi:hypothetical protein